MRSRTRSLAAALAIAAALTTGVPALAQSGGTGADQVVQGRVTAQFGFGVAPDGSFTTNATTIPASITRERVGDVEIITIAPAG